MHRVWTFALVALAAMTIAAPAAAGGKKRSATRVDFDDALIKGQTNQGAVHLIERKDSNLGSLVKKRTNFRNRILAPYGYETEDGLALEDETVTEESETAITKKSRSKSKQHDKPGRVASTRVVEKKR